MAVSVNKTTNAPETHSFNADVTRILEIVTHALYSNRDVFLRELISNAADACDRHRYETLNGTVPDQSKGHYAIHITTDTGNRTLKIVDNGIGMSKDDLVENLGTIARSGTKAIMDALQNKSDLSLIGQFGVGFYAAFMVASHVSVISRKAGSDESWQWESDGQGSYTLAEAAPLSHHGTEITLHIKDDASDYLLGPKLNTVIQTWSNHVPVPIYVDGAQDPANQAKALWTRPSHEISSEDYKSFYQSISHGMDEPLKTIHWKAEGVIEYSALLFIPSMRPWDLYDPQRLNALRLHVRKVFVTDQCEGLIPPWLRFLRGVVDSTDLPLNISREMLQFNPVISKMRNGIISKFFKEMNKVYESDTETRNLFWGQFGSVLKEGLYDSPEHHDSLLKLSLFHSLENPDGWTSLEEYVAAMPDDQEAIYYITGENPYSLASAPHLEGLKAKGYNVLFLTDTIDEYWLPMVPDFQGKAFQSATRIHQDHDDTPPENADPDLPARIKEALGDKVESVRYSSRLKESAACLVASDQDLDLHMARLMQKSQGYQNNTAPILEINPDHPVIQSLKQHPDFSDISSLLLDQAKIQQGLPVDDPQEFAARINSLILQK